MRRIGFVVALTLGLLGCANADTVEKVALKEGIERQFNAPYEMVKQTVVDALWLNSLKPSLVEDVPEGHIVMVARAPHGMSWGEVGRILVVRSEAPPTTVRVVYQRRAQIFQLNAESHFSRNLFAKMDSLLKTRVPPGTAAR